MGTNNSTPVSLEQVAFPALVTADDGWVEYVRSAERLSGWSLTALKKYRSRKVVLFDSSDKGWLLTGIVPTKRIGFLDTVLAFVRNSRIRATIQLQPISESPLKRVKALLEIAIDNDDDSLTQECEPEDLKSAIRGAQSFEGLVAALKAKRALVLSSD